MSDDDSKGTAPGDYIDQMPATNDLAVVTPYVVSFRCFTPELARVMTGFATSSERVYRQVRECAARGRQRFGSRSRDVSWCSSWNDAGDVPGNGASLNGPAGCRQGRPANSFKGATAPCRTRSGFGKIIAEDLRWTFSKKITKKILLGVVLAGLVGALVFMPFYIQSDVQKMKDLLIESTTNPHNAKALANLDMTASEGAVDRLKNPYVLGFGYQQQAVQPGPVAEGLWMAV